MNFRDAFGKYLLDLNMFYLAYYKKHRLKIFFINFLRKLKITKFIPKNLKKLSRCPKCGKETYYYEPLTILTDMTICTGCKVRFVVEN